jgi:hypothetical protein
VTGVGGARHAHALRAPGDDVRFRRLDAPRGKLLVWFEGSAHMPHYEEPARLREALLRALDVAPAPGPPLAAEDAGSIDSRRRLDAARV